MFHVKHSACFMPRNTIKRRFKSCIFSRNLYFLRPMDLYTPVLTITKHYNNFRIYNMEFYKVKLGLHKRTKLRTNAPLPLHRVNEIKQILQEHNIEKCLKNKPTLKVYFQKKGLFFLNHKLTHNRHSPFDNHAKKMDHLYSLESPQKKSKKMNRFLYHS